MPSLRFLRHLYVQVLLAITIGVFLGHFYPDLAVSLKPLGDAFVSLVKMIIAPVIFCTVVLGIAGMENLKAVGRTGALALFYFEVLSTVALVIGLVVVNVVQPGAGMNKDPSALAYTAPGSLKSVTQFLLDIIPDTMLGAFTRGDILPVLFIARAGRVRVAAKRPARQGCLHADRTVQPRAVHPRGLHHEAGAHRARSAQWPSPIGKFGIGSLRELGNLMLCFYLTCLLFVFGVLGAGCAGCTDSASGASCAISARSC